MLSQILSSFDPDSDVWADNFLQDGVASTMYVQGIVLTLYQICTKQRLYPLDEIHLRKLSSFLLVIATNGSTDVFREHVEESTVRIWLNCVICRLERLRYNRRWIQCGELESHDFCLLQCCGGLMNHLFPVSCAFGGEIFNALAKFVQARKETTGRALPCDNVCCIVAVVISNAYFTSRYRFESNWTAKQALKKLEATGVLEEFIRCASCPQASSEDRPAVLHMLDELQECLSFIIKRLKPGLPCGDVVVAILEGRDGSRVENHILLHKLKTIKRFLEHHEDGHDMCSNCGKLDLQASFKMCCKCKESFYCSQECYLANWAVHKKTCFEQTPERKKDFVLWAYCQKVCNAFVQNQYPHIMAKMVEACDKTGLSKNDMLVELNFCVDHDTGIVPAMQEKPEFKVTPIEDYVKGPVLPDSNMEEKIADCEIVKRTRRLVQPDQFYFLINYEGGTSHWPTGRRDPTTNKKTFSEEAVTACKVYMSNGDDGPLSKIFEHEFLQTLKRDLSYP